MHVLVQNLQWDFSQIAIPFEGVDEELPRTPGLRVLRDKTDQGAPMTRSVHRERHRTERIG